MLKAQSAKLDRKKLFGDPVLITTIVILVILLALFILYPLSMLLIDSIWGDNGLTLSVFGRVLEMGTFRTAFTNTLRLGFIVGIGSMWTSSPGLCAGSSMWSACCRWFPRPSC